MMKKGGARTEINEFENTINDAQYRVLAVDEQESGLAPSKHPSSRKLF